MSNGKEQKIGFSATLLGLCLIILCQPNISILDVFPDFIAFFILAKTLSRAALVLPYLDEAKTTFYRLAFLDIFRFFCQFLVFSAVNSDTQSDTMALFSFSFSVIEGFFLIKAIHQMFDGLFYLGERSACTALIHPFRVLGVEIAPEKAEWILEGFVVIKSLLSCLPDLIRLFAKTRTALLYRNAVLVCLILGILAAIATCIVIFRYMASVKAQNRFCESLAAVYAQNESTSEEHNKSQILSTAFLFMFVSTIFTAFLPIDTLGQTDLFPGFLFPFLFLCGLYVLRQIFPVNRWVNRIGIGLCAVSFLSFVLRPIYFSSFDLLDISSESQAQALYGFYEGISIGECILAILFLYLLWRNFDALILNHTGVPCSSADYRQTDKDFHRGMQKMNLATTLFGIAATICRTVKIITDSNSAATFVSNNGVIVGSVTMSAVPWLGMVINVFAVLYIALFYYFSSTLKEEWTL